MIVLLILFLLYGVSMVVWGLDIILVEDNLANGLIQIIPVLPTFYIMKWAFEIFFRDEDTLYNREMMAEAFKYNMWY